MFTVKNSIKRMTPRLPVWSTSAGIPAGVIAPEEELERETSPLRMVAPITNPRM